MIITATLVTDHTSTYRTVESISIFCELPVVLSFQNGDEVRFAAGDSKVYGYAKKLLERCVVKH